MSLFVGAVILGEYITMTNFVFVSVQFICRQPRKHFSYFFFLLTFVSGVI